MTNIYEYKTEEIVTKLYELAKQYQIIIDEVTETEYPYKTKYVFRDKDNVKSCEYYYRDIYNRICADQDINTAMTIFIKHVLIELDLMIPLKDCLILNDNINTGLILTDIKQCVKCLFDIHSGYDEFSKEEVLGKLFYSIMSYCELNDISMLDIFENLPSM